MNIKLNPIITKDDNKYSFFTAMQYPRAYLYAKENTKYNWQSKFCFNLSLNQPNCFAYASINNRQVPNNNPQARIAANELKT